MKTKVIFSSLLCLMMAQNLFAELPKLNELTPQAKAKISDKVLSKDEIMQGAERTQNLYIFCLSQTAEKLKMMYPDAKKEIIYDTLSTACEYPEDIFSIYNILLAASSMNKPMSEKQASVFLEDSYKKQGREKSNGELRNEILKSLKIIE